MSSKILLLEDDQLLAQTLIELLEDEGYTVSHAANGQAALDIVYAQNFDCYLLDINVPLINGITLLGELRAANDTTPAIFLTSHKESSMLTNGFECGCDDYITKPFQPNELLLRLKALLRRSSKSVPECFANLCHDKEHRCIQFDGAPLELSLKEYQLLALFMEHPEQTVPKELILERLWSAGEAGSDGAVRVYIARLKQLLIGFDIQNIRGIGYKLVSNA